MVENRTNVVMITEEDIGQLLNEWDNVPSWVKTHLTTKCPAHRYEGELKLDDENLVFGGRDMKEGKSFELEIPFERITDVCFGFSDDLQTNNDPAFGICGPAPFAVRYQDNGNNKTVYFNTCSDNYPPHMYINNIRWYEELVEIVAKHMNR
jgi:hypothetical protein